MICESSILISECWCSRAALLISCLQRCIAFRLHSFHKQLQCSCKTKCTGIAHLREAELGGLRQAPLQVPHLPAG